MPPDGVTRLWLAALLSGEQERHHFGAVTASQLKQTYSFLLK